MKSLAQARIKRTRAVELLAAGKSYDEIARAVGYSHRGSAHRAVFKALDEREVEDVDNLRAVEVARLDALQVVLWPRVQDGDVEAITVALRIIEQRSRILGLVPARRRHVGGHGPHSGDVMSMVVGPLEGNPEKATLTAVRRWVSGS